MKFNIRDLSAGALATLITTHFLQAQVEVPLQLINVGDDVYRVGINLSFGAESGATEQRLFLFDTGSSPLIANENVDIGNSAFSGREGLASYGFNDDDKHPYKVYNGSVIIEDRQGATHTISNVDFGQAYTTSTYPNGGYLTEPPFYGIIGASLTPSLYEWESNTYALYSALGQIAAGSGLKPGFTVDIASSKKSLYMGVSDQQIANFDFVAPMNHLVGTAASYNVFPNTGYTTYSQNIINTRLAINGEELSTEAIPTAFDSGAPDVTLLTGPTDWPDLNIPEVPSEYLTTEGEFEYITDGVPLVLGVFEGDGIINYDSEYAYHPTRTEVKTAEEDAHLNTGILPFFYYQMTFLLDDGTGQGYVGFTLVPEPEHYALGLGALSLIVLAVRRRLS
ncbi:hypothetical protein [Cerasicoccus frondis]|uniref:hypothetical protein n=1 Tax=Cerasicoccus frondis TaxID=490090 RepID=UPI0028524D30|nr:hypothetical protein [Cerasicoccus frondis]